MWCSSVWTTYQRWGSGGFGFSTAGILLPAVAPALLVAAIPFALLLVYRDLRHDNLVEGFLRLLAQRGCAAGHRGMESRPLLFAVLLRVRVALVNALRLMGKGGCQEICWTRGGLITRDHDAQGEEG